MEKIENIRKVFRSVLEDFSKASGSDAAYQHGKMVGIIEGVSMMMGISWIEADVLLRKTE